MISKKKYIRKAAKIFRRKYKLNKRFARETAEILYDNNFDDDNIDDDVEYAVDQEMSVWGD